MGDGVSHEPRREVREVVERLHWDIFKNPNATAETRAALTDAPPSSGT
jgi:hypothetical protein